ncbi:uncharacterized protein LOC124133554 [Haliotis rufescens]|uniref:uncharacterized protein LOC124133554 n=1 Tax=Haliotis rufescens TaxID=6454 RepID=UPI00201E80EE|nr:uncharacterized protein LOC124133554 [Haliotis rufescens]
MSRGRRGRGRRGARGGRGRGRGRGRSGGRGRSASASNPGNDEEGSAPEQLDIETRPKDFFTGTASVAQHIKGQTDNLDRYAATMAVLRKSGVAVAQNACVRALTAAWARHDYKLADAFLQNREQFGFVEVLKALTLLDSGRRVRVLEKKLKRLQLTGSKISKKKFGKLKSDIDNLHAIKPPQGSASGAVCKHVQAWVRTFTKEDLEFYALHYPKDPWKKLADICHFSPKTDFAVLPWFLPFCPGDSPPEGSMVDRCCDITEANVNDLIKEYDVPYTHVKKHQSKLTKSSKARLAAYEPKLDTVLWWYEDLQCLEVDKIITERLEAGENVNLANGKLLERLLTLKILSKNNPTSYFCTMARTWVSNYTKVSFLPKLIPLAETRLTSIKLPLESPIVVMGDASGSMEVAIQTSTIIASLLTAICSARLVFFDHENREAPYLPKTIDEVLELAIETKAGGMTTPAASLWPFYEKKEVVKTFIMVTDEEENEKVQDMFFAELYKKYHDEVFPAKLVFMSFLESQHAKGKMVTELQEAGFHPLQFKLEEDRPDLTKLDNLFGLLSSDSASFKDEITEMQKNITKLGLGKFFKG